MDIQSIQQVQSRIKEIKSRFKAIQNTYSRVSPFPASVVTNSNVTQSPKEADTAGSTVESQKNNSNNVKITDEILKNVINAKNKNSKGTIDVEQIQNLLQKAITQYTANGKIFNIEE
ncbi:MAG: hypothetical protein N3F66_06965 [Spirochaetes bacterium]|nr:hypothetical protein [Spirochaetota bacterium]